MFALKRTQKGSPESDKPPQKKTPLNETAESLLDSLLDLRQRRPDVIPPNVAYVLSGEAVEEIEALEIEKLQLEPVKKRSPRGRTRAIKSPRKRQTAKKTGRRGVVPPRVDPSRVAPPKRQPFLPRKTVRGIVRPWMRRVEKRTETLEPIVESHYEGNLLIQTTVERRITREVFAVEEREIEIEEEEEIETCINCAKEAKFECIANCCKGEKVYCSIKCH